MTASLLQLCCEMKIICSREILKLSYFKSVNLKYVNFQWKE